LRRPATRPYPEHLSRRPRDRSRGSLCVVPALAIALGWALAAPAAAESLPPDFLGVYSEDTQAAEPAARDMTLAQQRDTGIGVVRVPFDWAAMQPDPDRYELAATDEYVLATARAGLRVLPFLIQSPGWASSQPPGDGGGRMWPPVYPDFITGFAERLVERYGPRGSLWREHPEVAPMPIRAWQVWNEPNLPAFWASGPDPVAYTRLLESAARSIRSVDPDAEIVAAGLPETGIDVPMAEFLSDMYDAGAGAAMDTVAIHTYAAGPEQAVQVVADARAVADAHGDDARVWVTELGWATAGRHRYLVTDEAGQAERIRRELDLLARDRGRLRLRGAVVYSWRDSDGPGWTAHAGLRRLDASPKPSWFAVRDAADALGLRGAAAGEPADPAVRRADGSDAVAGAAGRDEWLLHLSARRRLRPTRRGAVRVAVRCGRDAVWYCAGSAWLEAPGLGRHGAPLQLGTGAFRARAGRTDRVTVRLSARARRLLRERRALRVVVRAGGVDLHGRVAEARLGTRLARAAPR
jgi:hypothetical protein